MTNELTLGLVLFAAVSSITPGPNNLMLMASGANYGFRRTLPHLLGVEVGFTVMVVLVGTGISGVFDRYPISYPVLRVASILYLGYLALKLATAQSLNVRSTGEPKPMTFLQAALFQWVNPKAWAMALTALSVYTVRPGLFAIVLVASVFVLIGLPSVSLWTLLGQQLRKLLSDETHLKRFNAAMALLLVASLLPLLGL